MAKKYMVAPGEAFTAKGHIYAAGEIIPEAVFSDKKYFSKLLSQKKILEVVGESETKSETKTTKSKKTKTETATETETENETESETKAE